MDFSGKRVLVTGAGRGIGRSVALRLASMGAEVFGVSRTQTDLDSLKKENPAIHIQSLDVGDWDVTREAIQKMLPLDFVVNNAAVLYSTPLLDLSRDKYENMIRVNLEGPLNIIQTVAKDLIARKRKGNIVNISSVAAVKPLKGIEGYCSTKSALSMLTKSFACELGPHGIRVNSVNPTLILTKMGLDCGDFVQEFFRKATPLLGKLGEVEEIVEAVVFLLSEKSSNITGVDLPVDGGFLVA